jgi:hypothetical protein
MRATKQALNDCLPGIATKNCQIESTRMDNIVNYVKAGGSIVLKFEVFACGGEEKTSTDNMASFTQG